MKVKELIEILNKCNEESDIVVTTWRENLESEPYTDDFPVQAVFSYSDNKIVRLCIDEDTIEELQGE